MSVSGRMDKEDVVCKYMYNGILFGHKKEENPDTTTWMDLDSIILSEISQNEKNKFYMISLMGGILNSQTHRIRA